MNPGVLWYLSTKAYKANLTFVARFLKLCNFMMFRSLLPFEADLQQDIKLEHYGLCTVVHPNVTIGRRVRIFHHVTLATESVINSEHRIFIGDDVQIGAGAIVIGRGNESLTIGNGASIGAGAVVTRNVQPGQTVVGVPAAPLSNPRRNAAKLQTMSENINGPNEHFREANSTR